MKYKTTITNKQQKLPRTNSKKDRNPHLTVVICHFTGFCYLGVLKPICFNFIHNKLTNKENAFQHAVSFFICISYFLSLLVISASFVCLSHSK